MLHAQTAEKIAPGISELSPRHKESDLTGPKWREGCASDLKIREAPQRERSDTQKVTRGLQEHMLDFHKTLRSPRKVNIEKVKKRHFT